MKPQYPNTYLKHLKALFRSTGIKQCERLKLALKSTALILVTILAIPALPIVAFVLMKGQAKEERKETEVIHKAEVI